MNITKSISGLALLLGACATEMSQVKDNMVLDLPVIVDGRRIGNYRTEYGVDEARKAEKCTKRIVRVDLPDGKNFYSAELESCFTARSNGLRADVYTLTETGRGKTFPTREVFVMPAQDGKGKNTSEYCISRSWKNTPEGLVSTDSLDKCDFFLGQIKPADTKK